MMACRSELLEDIGHRRGARRCVRLAGDLRMVGSAAVQARREPERDLAHGIGASLNPIPDLGCEGDSLIKGLPLRGGQRHPFANDAAPHRVAPVHDTVLLLMTRSGAWRATPALC